MQPVPKRILHVSETPLGGVTSCLQELVRSQVTLDVDTVEVITPEVNLPEFSGPDFDGPEGNKLRLTPFRHSRGSVQTLVRLTRLTLERARLTRPDIVHVHSTIAGIVVRLCRPLLPRGTRIVYCPHGWAFQREDSALKNQAIALVERALSPLSDRILCVSSYEKTDAAAVGISDTRTVVIENGVSPRGLAGRSRAAGDRKIIAFAGRFDRQKGFHTYVEVMRQLGDEARGIAIGRPILSSIDLSDLPPNIELLGWQPRERVCELYAQADLLLMPSRWEGFPLFALEAMQARTAVWASRVGGLRDIVLDGETGRLFDLDDVAAIVDGIRSTSRDALWAQGERGHARYLERYTAKLMNSRVLDLYSELMRRPEPDVKAMPLSA